MSRVINKRAKNYQVLVMRIRRAEIRIKNVILGGMKSSFGVFYRLIFVFVNQSDSNLYPVIRDDCYIMIISHY